MQKVKNKRLLISSLYICILLCAGSCAGTKKISYQEAKEVAEQKTQQLKVPVEVKTKADSAQLKVNPNQLKPGRSIETTTEEGLTLIVTKLLDGLLDVKALQTPRVIHDTVVREVPVNVFDECKIDGHLSRDQVEQKIKEEVDRHLLQERERNNLGERLATVLVFLAWSVAGLLFLFLVIVGIKIYQAFK